MNEQHPQLQIGVYAVDGSARIFLQNDPDLANRTLSDLHPALIFTRERITIAHEDTEVVVVPTLITRIDLMTDLWSVWDFPFVLGAPVEVTEGEFMEGIQGLQQWKQPSPSSGMPVFIDIEMLNGQRLFLWMRVVAGLSSARLSKIYSLLKERYLVFGLRTRGIGVLNLSNLVRFSVYPEPPPMTADGDAEATMNPPWHPPAKETAHPVHPSHRNHASPGITKQKQPARAALERK